MSIVFVVVMAVGALLVGREFRQAQERPGVQRLESQRRLGQFAAALAAYQGRHHDWPDNLFQVMKDQHLGFGANLVRGGGTYRYRKPGRDDGADRVVMWSDLPHQGVKAGEPWGGEGEVATSDHPPVSYVLTRDLRIEEVGLEAWRTRTGQAADSAAAPAPAPAPEH